MQTFAGRPSTSSSLIPADIPQNSMVGQQRQQISKLQFDKFLNPQSFFWKRADSSSIFVVAEFVSDDSNFWCVRGSITCNETVDVHVLWPVCTDTIPFRMLLCP